MRAKNTALHFQPIRSKSMQPCFELLAVNSPRAACTGLNSGTRMNFWLANRC